jgi:hypothetical protein
MLIFQVNLWEYSVLSHRTLGGKMKNPTNPKTVRATPPARATKKSVLFVDLPFLANGIRFDLYDLLKNLRNEFHEIRTYAFIRARASADEVIDVHDYGKEFLSSSSDKSSDYQIGAIEEESEVSVVTTHARGQYPKKGYFGMVGGEQNE